jgi:hypothetical protein
MAGFVVCFWCHKVFERNKRQINEAKKFGWKQFCSITCQKKYRRKGKKLTCDSPSCNKRFYRRRGDINKTIRSFCSRRCRTVVINFEKGIINQKKCANKNCNNLVPPYDKFCSNNCFQENRSFLNLDRYKREVLLQIKAFNKANGRIPFKQEMYRIYKPARTVFGTWNRAIEAAGFKPNQLKFTHKYMANDKHICDSLAEKIIDDWLFAREIEHQHGVYDPGQKKFKTDFKVGDYWIEFFGLEGQLIRYDELKKEKLNMIKRSKLKLIKIYPKDIIPKNELDKILSGLKKRYSRLYKKLARP